MSYLEAIKDEPAIRKVYPYHMKPYYQPSLITFRTL